MRIWVVGGAGFIGSHLCEALLSEGHEVVALDNLSSGSQENLKVCQGFEEFEFLFWDVERMEPILGCDPQVIFHLASLASPVDYLRDPVRTITANTIGTYNLLQYSERVNSKFIYASTSEIYGDPVSTPQIEGDSGRMKPESPRAPYYISKATGETLVYAYAERKNVNASVVRIFNTYGPRMRDQDGRCVPTFISKALNGEDIPVHGDGAQTRSLCYVDDTVRALKKMLLCDDTGPINIGNNQEISIVSLARFIIALTGSQSQVKHQQGAVDDPRRRCPDISLAHKLLGWDPEVSLQAGLLRTIEHYRSSQIAAA